MLRSQAFVVVAGEAYTLIIIINTIRAAAVEINFMNMKVRQLLAYDSLISDIPAAQRCVRVYAGMSIVECDKRTDAIRQMRMHFSINYSESKLFNIPIRPDYFGSSEAAAIC